jgi:putative membrane protein
MSLHDLPALNATLNAICSVLLVVALIFIKRGNRVAHQRCMIAALITSAIFLTSYLTYHIMVKTVTKFVEPAYFRPYYLTFLFSHLILAIAILPLIAITFTRALRERFDAHRKIARWTWPLWMYVSVTGVLIYLLLYQIFPQPKNNPQLPLTSTQTTSPAALRQ